MANGLTNASFLDGAAGWGGGAPDEANVGAEGRIVLAGGGTSAAVAIAGGVAEVSGFCAPGGVITAIVGGGEVAIPRVSRGTGPARRGLPATFDHYRGRVAGANVAIKSTSSLLKPFVGPALPAPRWNLWEPGAHANPDLDLPRWPSTIGAPAEDSFSIEPIPTRKGFAGDAGVESTRRITLTPRVRARVGYSLTMEERDTLEQFFQAGAEPFYFVRYDTQQLCRAWWLADGEPADSGMRLGKRTVTIGLALEVT